MDIDLNRPIQFEETRSETTDLNHPLIHDDEAQDGSLMTQADTDPVNNDLNQSQCCEENEDDGLPRFDNVDSEEQVIDISKVDFNTKCVITRSEDNTYKYTPVCEDDKRPCIGMVFPTVEDGFNFYKYYASICGFEIRRGTDRKYRDGTILRKYFYCSKQGGERSSSFDTLHTSKNSLKRKRLSTRSHCLAYMRLRFDGPERFVVADFIESHNHEMSSELCSQFLKSCRNLSLPHKAMIVNCSRVNMGPVRSYNLCKQFAGGFQNVGAQKIDFKNFSRDIVAYIGDADAQMVIDKLIHKKNMDDEFFLSMWKKRVCSPVCFGLIQFPEETFMHLVMWYRLMLRTAQTSMFETVCSSILHVTITDCTLVLTRYYN